MFDMAIDHAAFLGLLISFSRALLNWVLSTHFVCLELYFYKNIPSGSGDIFIDFIFGFVGTAGCSELFLSPLMLGGLE